jgi:hypothetical protein
MIQRFSTWVVFLAAMLFLGAGAALADTLTFTDGNTLTGSFVYDTTTNTVVSFNFTSAAGGSTTSFVNGVNSSSALVSNNQDGDQVFSFFSLEPAQQQVDELDIVLSCVGTANCAQQATTGNSFAITAGQPTCGPTGFCIASGEQFNVPESLQQILLGSGQSFAIVTDPTCPATDSCFTLTLSSTSTGTVFDGGGGGGNTSVPEPSTLVLTALGFGAFILKRVYS